MFGQFDPTVLAHFHAFFLGEGKWGRKKVQAYHKA